VGVDVQGAERVRPWVEKAKAAYPCLVDPRAELAARLGVNYVPFAVMIDEAGRRVGGPLPINVGRAEHRELVSDWF